MKRNFFNLLPYLVVAVCLIFYFVRYKVPPNIMFSDVTVKDLAGNDVKLGEAMKTPAIVHFYANWCGPCRKELPELASISTQLKDAGCHIYLITDDSAEQAKEWQQMFQDNAEFYTIGELKTVGIRTIPATYIVSTEGEIVLKKLAPIEWKTQEFLDEFKALIHISD